LRANKPRLSVFDLIVLIAATAPGLALARKLPDYVAVEHSVMVCNELTRTPSSEGNSGLGWTTSPGMKWFQSTGRPLKERPSYWLVHVPCWASPCLLGWTVAAMALSLRGPRPNLRRLARCPGVAAGLAVLVALVVQGMDSLRFLTTNGEQLGSFRDGWGMHGVYVLTSFARLAAFSVAAWWLALALSGRWAPEANAAGRLGQVFGWCWIALAVSGEIGLWCFSLNS
jgi:hypothetical protein